MLGYSFKIKRKVANLRYKGLLVVLGEGMGRHELAKKKKKKKYTDGLKFPLACMKMSPIFFLYREGMSELNSCFELLALASRFRCH